MTSIENTKFLRKHISKLYRHLSNHDPLQKYCLEQQKFSCVNKKTQLIFDDKYNKKWGITKMFSLEKIIEVSKTVSHKLKPGNGFSSKIVEAFKAFDCHKYTERQQKERH